jgi:hypothetical protein
MAIIALIVTAVMYIVVTTQIEPGQVWVRCEHGKNYKGQETPWEPNFCEFRRIKKVSGLWAKYDVWYTGWAEGKTMEEDDYLYTFLYMHQKED